MIRIAITGPESSGKTTLAQELSQRLSAIYIPEFAREYLQETDGQYNLDDLDDIARGHLNNIEKSQNSIQIIDTDFIVLKVWSEFRFGLTSSYIEELISKQLFDFYFLCKPDIPWEADPLRENPNDREELFELYLKELDHYQLPYKVILGSVENRVKNCLHILDERLNLKS